MISLLYEPCLIFACPGQATSIGISNGRSQWHAAACSFSKLPVLQGELDVVLDLINLMEGQHFLGVANIALPSNLQLENQQQALRLQQKVSQLKVHLTYLLPHYCTH